MEDVCWCEDGKTGEGLREGWRGGVGCHYYILREEEVRCGWEGAWREEGGRTKGRRTAKSIVFVIGLDHIHRRVIGRPVNPLISISIHSSKENQDVPNPKKYAHLSST